jgi:GNAT superfamily N-acetyltransferase
MSHWPRFIAPEDLAPGDSSPHPALPRALKLHVVESSANPLFAAACLLLEGEFGAKGEMEPRSVLAERLRWNPAVPQNGCGMLYNLMLLMVGDEVAALCDHTAILRADYEEVVVHLSHAFVTPKWRRKGLAAVLRTLPVLTARRSASLIGRVEAPVTLFAEMEPIDLSVPANKIRRTSYERAGYWALGAHLGYLQPDFRPPEAIDADPSGAKPLPFDIVLRRVGRERKTTIGANHLIADIELIYAMYATGFRAQDMEGCRQWLEKFKTRTETSYPLFKPTLVK